MGRIIISIDVIDGEARDSIRLRQAKNKDLSMALAHLDMIKLKITTEFAKSCNMERVK